MFINRVIMLLLIIASTIFVSYYGGTVSYALFYMSLFIPLVSATYTFYVYVRFRIYQDVGQRIVIKGDLVPYSFTLSNEDYITFRSIKVNFLHDRSSIADLDEIKEYCLLPGQSEKMETHLRCNYRGEYAIGVSSVDITDFLYLFKITYPISTKLRVTVLPRVVHIPSLNIAPPVKDVKNAPYIANQSLDILDLETRRYIAGDSKKQIHWRTSAKRGQLYSRKFMSNPKTEMAIVMDLKSIQEDSLTATIVEDQIIEGTLAIANYCVENNTKVKVFYEQDGIKNISIKGKREFDLFYQLTVQMLFHSSVSVENTLQECLNFTENTGFYIVITHEISYELYKVMLEFSERGKDLSLLLICDKVGMDEEEMIKSLKLSGILVRQVMREDEIGEVLKA